MGPVNMLCEYSLAFLMSKGLPYVEAGRNCPCAFMGQRGDAGKSIIGCRFVKIIIQITNKSKPK